MSLQSETEPLTRYQEIDMARRMKDGDQTARDRLIMSCYAMVFEVAKKRISHVRRSDREDFVQAGFVGLITAVDKYDCSRGIRLSTYAWTSIDFAMSTFVKMARRLKHMRTKRCPWLDEFPERRPGPEANVMGKETIDQVEETMHDFTDRERNIMHLRVFNEDATTLGDIGAMYGVTKERIRQIEGRGVRKIRARLAKSCENLC